MESIKKTYFKLKRQHNSTENQINKTDKVSEVKSRIQSIEVGEPGWVYNKRVPLIK